MKKSLIPISLLAVGLVAYYFWGMKTPQNTPENTPEKMIPESAYSELNDTQTKVFSTVFDKETMKSQAFKVFSDPATSADFYLEGANLSAEAGKEFLKKAFKNLKDCAKEGCGQGPDDDGFYDPANTVAMISMKRILEAALIDPEGLEAKEWLQKEDLLDYLETPNQKVRQLALKNLLTLHQGEEIVSDIMNKGKELKGYQAADIVEALLPYANAGDTEGFVAGVIDIMSGKDALTITEVLEKSEGLKANIDQIEKIGSELCPYKRESGQEANFKAMNYSMKVMAQNNQLSFSLDSYCR